MEPLENANGDTTPRAIMDVAVIGGGSGSIGVIEACLLAGLSATMIRTTPGSVSEARRRLVSSLDDKRRGGRLDRDAIERALDLLRASGDIGAAASADLVLESTDSAWKTRQTLLAQAERATQGRAILATTAPTALLRALSTRLDVRENFVGLHFFAPAVLAGFCEVSVTNRTQPTVVETAVQFVKALGKHAVIVHDTPACLLLQSQGARLGTTRGASARSSLERLDAAPGFCGTAGRIVV
ncbi:3-hydroxyacyl-CoA dehydrogenase NAD-binding domain-containing protein [Polyangium sp. y55x31]|uniref:3-hydroxyacyl-CoA dehydrogenase NAD-binding domain-containing protein n=1 Tax=Polyangium sp. y55x31 TaxID=3042688 RepID=UPI0024828F84|nr:3-hydroxyacyl-CoA dehydrogenase NAD-binding domain-containing protein [Polyangium sp. y55x31]MDI1476989.1 3-hydroxyacyl-CoA dehydrogenase NAD-binding domain-containing protein [Polyangium sp. y55x31]